MKITRPQLAAIAIAAAAIVAGKHYYRDAGADQLAWLLAPTAKLVSALTGSHFVREAGVGYIDPRVAFEIAPVCAGLNFLLAAFLALAVAWFGGMRTWRGMARRLAAAATLAYAATLVVNTLRIAIAIRLHAGSDLHRLEGVVVYLGGLCTLYAAARSLHGRQEHATP